MAHDQVLELRRLDQQVPQVLTVLDNNFPLAHPCSPGGRLVHRPKRATLLPVAERHLNGPFVCAAHDVQLDGAALCRLERVEQIGGCAGRPGGPRKVRSIPEPTPNVTLSPRPPGLDRANTGIPSSADEPLAHCSAGAPPVSTLMTARSPSMSCPATLPSAVRPSANVTVTWSPRTLCALVSTCPSASTMPEPT